MTRAWPWFAMALGLYGAATGIRQPGEGLGLQPVQALARPLVLPFLWQGLRYAQHHEDPSALAARGQQLLALLPMWTDGHVLFASELALAASQRAPDADAALDRLLAALALLEAAADARPQQASRYLAAMASFAAIRGRQSPALAERMRARLGTDPAALADALLARAEARDAGASLRDQRTFLLSSVIAGAIRTGDLGRARATLETMLERLDSVLDRDLAARQAASLHRLARHLEDSAAVPLEDLAADPLLEEIVPALRQRRDR